MNKEFDNLYENYSSDLDKLIRPNCTKEFIKNKNKDKPIKPNAFRASINLPMALITDELITKINDLLVNNSIIDKNRGVGKLYLDLKSKLKDNKDFIKDLNKLGKNVIDSYRDSFKECGYTSLLMLNNNLMTFIPELKELDINKTSCTQNFDIALFHFSVKLSYVDDLRNLFNEVKQLNSNIELWSELVQDNYYPMQDYDLLTLLKDTYLKVYCRDGVLPIEDYLLLEGDYNHEYRLSKQGRVYCHFNYPRKNVDDDYPHQYMGIHEFSTTKLLRSFGNLFPFTADFNEGTVDTSLYSSKCLLNDGMIENKVPYTLDWCNYKGDDQLFGFNETDVFNLTSQEVIILKDIFKFINKDIKLKA